jgi:hypothetical protein
MPAMDYQVAKDIRGKSFGELMTDKLLQDKGIGASLGATISEKTKARVTGIKQAFDPLNMARIVTGGSSLGPSILGKILGRKKEDIKFFAGRTRKRRGTAEKLGPVESGDINSVLINIESLLRSSIEQDNLLREKENAFAEEKEAERLRRHKELIAAITGKPYSNKTSATKVSKDEEENNIILPMLGLKSVGKIALKGLGSLAKFAIGPIGAPLLAAASIGAFGYFIYKSLKAEPSYEAEQEAKGLEQARSVGGLAGVKDEMEKRKKLPEYDRTVADIKDYETVQNEGQKLNNTQLEGFAKRGPGALEAVEDYKVQRDKYLQITGEQPTVPGQVPIQDNIPTATPVPSSSGGSSAVTPTSTDTSSAMPVIPPTIGETLNNVINENLTTNIQETLAEGLNVVNNSTIKQAIRGKEVKTSIPPVRNMEESFQKMIFESTRVL